jgi:hypothetical protein
MYLCSEVEKKKGRMQTRECQTAFCILHCPRRQLHPRRNREGAVGGDLGRMSRSLSINRSFS